MLKADSGHKNNHLFSMLSTGIQTYAKNLPRWTPAALIGLAALIVRLGSLGTLTQNYDEGVYFASLRSLAQGQRLYAQIYHAQPPYFLPLILPFYSLGGETLMAARTGILFYSLIGIAAMGWLASTLWDKHAAYVAMLWLAIDPLYVPLSIAVQAEVPALAFMLLAVAIAAHYRKTMRPVWAACAGLTFVFSMGIKLFTVPAIIPIAYFLLEPHLRQGKRSGIIVQDLRRSFHRGKSIVLFFAIGLAIGLLPLIIFIWPAPLAAYQQIIGLHAQAAAAYAGDRLQNMHLFLADWWEGVAISIGALNAWALWQKQQYDGIVLMTWGVVSIAALAIQTPLFDHHIVLIVPPFIIIASTIQINLASLRPKSIFYWVLLLVFAGVIAATDHLRPTASTIASEREIVVKAVIVANYTAPDQYVITDDQLPVALAQRSIPPALDDTSQVRIASGALTTLQVINEARQPTVAAILWSSGRFDALPGLKQWVEQHFTCIFTFGNDQCLYLKNTSAGQPVAGIPSTGTGYVP